ncbi:MAG: hypothetical protein FJX55_01230 [Alphaproteobacteria bacterium]|nr:hypothetical protein [Alphaproteobacteria bacterium]
MTTSRSRTLIGVPGGVSLSAATPRPLNEPKNGAGAEFASCAWAWLERPATSATTTAAAKRSAGIMP